jgi:hypothetical protein
MCVGAGRSARRPSALSRGGLWVGLGPRRRFSVPAAAEELLLLLIEGAPAVLRKFTLLFLYCFRPIFVLLPLI